MKIKCLNEECEIISKSCDLEFGKMSSTHLESCELFQSDARLNEIGYDIFSLKALDTFNQLETIITNQIKQRLSLYQAVPSDFSLSSYHECLLRAETHFKLSTWGLEYDIFGSAFYALKEQIEERLKLNLKVKRINHMGVDGDYIGFRIIRPMKNDHNPFHRDSWIPYWRDTINVWLPICGFEDSNSLQLIPKSHLWRDDEILKTKAGVEIDGKKYHVPAAIGTNNDFTIETPNLKKGEGLIFSPFLIHGNGANKSENCTRVSLEFRFCRT